MKLEKAIVLTFLYLILVSSLIYIVAISYKTDQYIKSSKQEPITSARVLSLMPPALRDILYSKGCLDEYVDVVVKQSKIDSLSVEVTDMKLVNKMNTTQYLLAYPDSPLKESFK